AVVVVRKAQQRDLDREDAFSINAGDERVHAPLLGLVSTHMVPLSMRGVEPDESQSYTFVRAGMAKKQKQRSAAELPTAPAFDSDAEESTFWRTHSYLEFRH